MIGQLRGTILEKQAPLLVLEVNGVGYEVDVPMSTFCHLPEVGQMVVVHTHFVVREDAQCLYGFFSRNERALFRTLLKVNGVGPKLALAILSSIEPKEFIHCVLNGDAASLTNLPGVGKKTAERLIIEMRDKLSAQQFSDSVVLGESNIRREPDARNLVYQDAVAALVALGYKPQEANKLVVRLDDGQKNSEEIIRLALRERIV